MFGIENKERQQLDVCTMKTDMILCENNGLRIGLYNLGIFSMSYTL